MHRLTGQTPVDDLGQTPGVAKHELGEEERHDAAGAAGDEGADGGVRHGVAVPGVGDGALRAGVEGHEAGDEDEAAEGDEGEGVAGEVLGAGVAEAVDPGAEDEGTCEVGGIVCFKGGMAKHCPSLS